MKMITKMEWEFLHTKTKEVVKLPAGEYEMEMREVSPFRPNGIRLRWLCIVGQPYGASLLSWLQWAPGQTRDSDSERGLKGGVINWGDAEVRVYDDAGELMTYPEEAAK